MWRAITAAALVIAVLAGLGGYLAYTFGPDRPPPLPAGAPATPPAVPQEKPSEAALPEGTQLATPLDMGRLVPTAASPPPGGSCPPRWLFFDNPALHYSVCYPPGWGFTDFSTSGPLTAIPARELGSVNIVPPDTFPYPVDIPYTERPAEVQERLARGFDVTIESFQPGLTREGCQPSTPVVINGVQATWCEDIYDILPGPEVTFSPQGSRHTLVIFLPLAQPPDLDILAPDLPPELRDGQPKSGWQLFIAVTGRTVAFPMEKDLQWQIANSIRVY